MVRTSWIGTLTRYSLACFAVFLSVLALVVFSPARSASAFEVREGTHVVIGPNEVIDGDLLATGQTVTIAGRVTGDAFVFAQTVDVSGDIVGDLITVSQRVTVSGRVGGNVRAAGNHIAVQGQVTRNFLGAGNLIVLGNQGEVGGSWTGAGSSIDVRGTIDRDLTVAGETVNLAGAVNRDVTATAKTLVVGTAGTVGGNLTYYSDDEATVMGAVAGEIERRDPERTRTFQQQADRAWRGFGNLVNAIWLIGTLIVGVLLVRFIPELATISRRQIVNRPLSTFLLGLGVLIGGPIAIVFLAITLVGLPLAFLSGMGYIAGIYLAWILFAVAAGALAIQLFQRSPVTVAPEWLVILGILGLFVLTRIPVLGGILGFVGLCLGLGILAVAIWQTLRPTPMVPG